MSKQTTKINYDEMKVEDGGIVYDMEDLARLNHIYERLCTAEYVFENWEKVTSMEQAYWIADYVRDEIDDYCTCEMEMLTVWASKALEYAEECLDIVDED